MSLKALGLSISFIWFAIYAVYGCLLRRTHDASLLPTPSSTGPRRRDSFTTSSVQIGLKKMHLRVQTTAWNKAHDRLASRLANKHSNKSKTFLKQFYNGGCFLGLAGMIIALGLLPWTAGNLSTSLIETSRQTWGRHEMADSVARSMKRTLEDTQVSQDGPSGGAIAMIKPIIPGVTVPLSHLPLVILSVFISQVIHEAGHALSAALESISILSVGLSFVVALPSAFIVLPSVSVEALKPIGRLRIVAAGPFHNLVFWILLVAGSWMGIGRVGWGLMGYEDVTGLGRVVVGLESDSPLRDYLSTDTLITKLDDTHLAIKDTRNSDVDIWTAYLTGAYSTNETQGWCVDNTWWQDKSQTCCHASDHLELSPPLSCFVAASSSAESRCIDPIPLLTETSKDNTHPRCSIAKPCSSGSKCIGPREGEQLLRITILNPDKKEEVVLWSGPKGEIREQVETGTFRPRYRMLPLMLPVLSRVFLEYLKMATLSLYLFNLLPLPFLDGSQFLETLLDLTLNSSERLSAEDFDLEALEGGNRPDIGRRSRRSTRGISKVIRFGTTGLLGACMVLAFINVAIS